MRFRFLHACTLLVALCGMPGHAGAQSALAPPVTRLDSLRLRYRIVGTPVAQVPVNASLGAPGSSFGSPTAFGAAAWDAFVGLGFQQRTRFTVKADAAVVVGFGLGNVETYGAFEVALTSFSTARHSVGAAGSTSVKYHHDLPHRVRGSIGVENAASWGSTDGGRSIYVAFARAVQLRDDEGKFLGALSMNGGLGNGRFRSENDILSGHETFAPFGSVGLRLNSITSVAADWTGADLNAGFAFIPIQGRGLSISAGLADLTGRSGDGVRFIFSLGYGANLRADGRHLSRKEQREAIPR